jgi:transcription antitermination factor NusG
LKDIAYIAHPLILLTLLQGCGSYTLQDFKQMGWACFQTHGSQEKKAVDNLREYWGLEAFSPFYVVPPKLLVKSDVIREAPMFPGYGFVKLDEDNAHLWGKVNNTYGVTRLLTDRNRDKPTPLWVPDDQIAQIDFARSLAESKALPANTVVRVKNKDSAFYDLVGTVIGMDKNQRIKVLMSLFNRDTIVEFDTVSDLQAIEV